MKINFPESPDSGDVYFADNGIIYRYLGSSIWEISGADSRQIDNESYTEPDSDIYDYWYSPDKAQILIYNENINDWEYLIDNNNKTKYGELDLELIYPTFPTSDFEDHNYIGYYTFLQKVSTETWEIKHNLNTDVALNFTLYNKSDYIIAGFTIFSDGSVGLMVPTPPYYMGFSNIDIIDKNTVSVTLNGESDGYAIVESFYYSKNYPEEYGIDTRILSTHYKTEFEFNTNPFDNDYILPKALATDLYNKWEEFRPITRVSHYVGKLDIRTDISGDEIPLYEEPAYDANLYATSNVFRNSCEDAFVFDQGGKSDLWEISHELDTKNVIVNVFKLNDENKLIQTIPEKIEIINKNYIEVTFSSEESGTASILKADYTDFQTSIFSGDLIWETIHNLKSLHLFFEVYDVNDQKIVPKNFEILDNNRCKIEYSKTIFGKVVLKKMDTSNSYVHNQVLLSDTWTVSHNLNSNDILFKVYDHNNKVVIPKIANVDNLNQLNLTFDGYIFGKCIVQMPSEDNFFYTQTTEDTDWYIEHNLDDIEFIFEVYDSDNNMIYPSYSENIDSDNLHLHFKTAVSGKCIIWSNVDAVVSKNWIVNHNYDQEPVINQIYAIDGDSFVATIPNSIEILDENSFQVDFSNSNQIGVAQVARIDESAISCEETGYGYLYTQTHNLLNWNVYHNLNNLCFVSSLYDNGTKLQPNEYSLTLDNKNLCIIEFPTQKRGRLSIRSTGNSTAGILGRFEENFIIEIKSKENLIDGIGTHTINCNSNNISFLNDKIQFNFEIPISVKGYFSIINIYDMNDVLCFYTNGDEPIYKHENILMDLNFNVFYNPIYRR